MLWLILVCFIVVTCIFLTYLCYKTMLLPKELPKQEEVLEEPHPLLFKKAPDFKLPSTKGVLYSLKELCRTGIILIFIDTYCPYCYAHLERFLNEAKKHQDLNFAVLVKESKDKPIEKVDQLFGEEYLILQADEEIFDQFQIRAYPTYMFVNREQVIKYGSDLFVESLFKMGQSNNLASEVVV